MDSQARCRELFQKLERQADGGRFHVATSDGEAITVSSFASAHHALALRHLDPALAAEELRTVFAECQVESGLVVAERPQDGERTPFVAPPVAAYAAARLLLAGDLGQRELLERASAQLDAIWGERLPPDTDLPVILHPAESGTPDSPAFDEVFEWTSTEERPAELASLARSAIACRCDPDRALRAGHAFVVEDPVFCGWFLLALEEVERAWVMLGDDAAAQKMAIRGRMIADAIAERLWSQEEQCFVARDRQRDALLEVVTAGGLVPAASRRLIDEGKARQCAGRQLAPGGSPLWGARGISFNPIVRDRQADGELTWRGNTASALTQYWAHLALVRTGRVSDARVARDQLESLIEAHGFLERYDAVNGSGGGGRDCALPALVLEMEASGA